MLAASEVWPLSYVYTYTARGIGTYGQICEGSQENVFQMESAAPLLALV